MKKLLIPLLPVFFLVSLNGQEWQKFSFIDAGGVYCASTELNKPADFSIGKYSPHNLFDRDPATAWVEGENGSGTGSYVCVGMGDSLLPYIFLANGYQKSHDLFLKNNRIRTLKVTLYLAFTDPLRETQAGFDVDAVAFPESRVIELKDTEGYQIIRVPFDAMEAGRFRDQMLREYVLSHKNALHQEKAYSWLKDFFFLKLEIADVYRGSKWDDTCLSDLLFGKKKELSFIPRNEKILTVRESENEGAIRVRTVPGNVYELLSVSNEEVRHGKTLSVAALSPDKQWAVIDIMQGGDGRDTEESYHLYYLPLLSEIPALQLYGMGEAIDFEEKNGRLYILFFDGEIPAEEVRNDMTTADNALFFHDAGMEALALLFSDAVRDHDTGAILSCMDDNYLQEQLVDFMENDTSAFLRDQFCGEPSSGGKYVCLPLQKVRVTGEPLLRMADPVRQVALTLTDGEKTITCRWTITENEGEGPEPVFGLVGGAG